MFLLAAQASATTVAWIAVIGTAVGALIGSASGGVVDFVIAALRDKRRAKAGARLVRLDLALAADQLRDAQADAKWWAFFETKMPAWEEYSDILAVKLGDEDFETVTQAVAALGRFHDGMRRSPQLAAGQPFAPLSSDSVERVGEMRDDATAGYNALAKLAGGTEVTGMLHDG